MFSTKVKNIKRGGANYCSRACNPAYAPKFTKAHKIKAQNLRRNYGLTVDQFDAMSKAQGGRCAICGDQPSRLVVDHNHSTGLVRGLLCQSCNLGIGHLRECRNRLAAASQYLERHDNEADALALLHLVEAGAA